MSHLKKTLSTAKFKTRLKLKNSAVFLVLICLFISSTIIYQSAYKSPSASDAELAAAQSFQTKMITEMNNDPEAKTSFTTFKKQTDVYLADTPKTSYIDPVSKKIVPIKTIDVKGRAFNDPYYIAVMESLKDFNKIYNFSYTYYLTKDPKYKNKALEFLNGWSAVNNVPSTNPIDETSVNFAVQGYAMIRPFLTSSQTLPVDGWLKKKADALRVVVDAEIGSNIKSHRLMLVGLIGFAVNDNNNVAWAEGQYVEQIKKNLNALNVPNAPMLSRVSSSIIKAETLKGASVDFIERDSLGYHTYDLRPLLTFAQWGKLKGRKINGQDAYFYTNTAGGYTSSLSKAVDFMLPYTIGVSGQAPISHVEFRDSVNVANGINLDQKKNCQSPTNSSIYGPSYCKPWVKSNSYAAFSLDSAFRPVSVGTLNKMMGKTGKYPTFEVMLYALENKVLAQSYVTPVPVTPSNPSTPRTGTPNTGPSTQKTGSVTKAGGVVSFESVRVEIPAGTSDEDLLVTINKIDPPKVKLNLNQKLISDFYEVTVENSEGIKLDSLKTQVSVSFGYDEKNLRGVSRSSIRLANIKDNRLVVVPTSIDGNKKVAKTLTDKPMVYVLSAQKINIWGVLSIVIATASAFVGLWYISAKVWRKRSVSHKKFETKICLGKLVGL